MTWFKVDDRSAFHGKVIAAGDAAWGLFCRAGAWSSGQGTNGLIPAHMVKQLCTAKARWAALVTAGLLEDAAGGAYQIHDFLQWNPSAEQTKEKRAARAAAGRRGGISSGQARSKTEAIASSDGSNCLPIASHQNEPRPVPSRLEISPEPSPLLSPPEKRDVAPAAAPGFVPSSNAVKAIHDALAASPRFAQLATREFCVQLAQKTGSDGNAGPHTLDDVLASIAEADAKAAIDQSVNELGDRKALARFVVGCVNTGSRRTQTESTPPRAMPPPPKTLAPEPRLVPQAELDGTTLPPNVRARLTQ